MEGDRPVSTEKKGDWGIKRIIKLIFTLVVIVLLLRGAVFFWADFFLNLFPRWDFLAGVAGYSTKIGTRGEINKIVSFKDGSFLVTRNIEQSRAPDGIRAFPDGGIWYKVAVKRDALLVSKDGDILWHGTYANSPVYAYNVAIHGNTSEAEASHLLDNNPVLALAFEDPATVRRCSPTVMQFAQKDRFAEIDLSKNSLRVVNDLSKLCSEQVARGNRLECNSASGGFIYTIGPTYTKPAYTLDWNGKKIQNGSVITADLAKIYYQFPCSFGGSGNGPFKADTSRAVIPPGSNDKTDIPFYND